MVCMSFLLGEEQVAEVALVRSGQFLCESERTLQLIPKHVKMFEDHTKPDKHD